MSNQFLKLKKKLPFLGVGLGLRRDIADETLNCKETIDWLEISPENYMGLGGTSRELLEKAADRFPLVSHGLNLSIGSTDDLNQDYLKALKALLDKVDAPWASDHLCFASFAGIYVQDLLPLPFSKEAINHVVKRIKRVQSYLERPFLLENISYYTCLPGREMTEAEFTAEILEKADCGLLLDVNNVYVNAVNHGYNPEQFIDQLPLERVLQLHIAGHKRRKDVIIDTHGAPVIQPVYDLLAYTLAKTEPLGVLLERDQNFGDFDELEAELKIVRKICADLQPNVFQMKVDKHAKAVSF